MNTNQEHLIELENKVYAYEVALQRIAKWYGEFPYTEFNGKECSYESAHGSNGARDYMRNIAKQALEKNYEWV